jgi:hypothetical protein
MSKRRWLSISYEPATTRSIIAAFESALDEAGEGGMRLVCDLLRGRVESGDYPCFVDAPGAVGRPRYDDSEALAMIDRLEPLFGIEGAIEQAAQAYGANASTIRRWKDRRREKNGG